MWVATSGCTLECAASVAVVRGSLEPGKVSAGHLPVRHFLVASQTFTYKSSASISRPRTSSTLSHSLVEPKRISLGREKMARFVMRHEPEIHGSVERENCASLSEISEVQRRQFFGTFFEPKKLLKNSLLDVSQPAFRPDRPVSTRTSRVMIRALSRPRSAAICSRSRGITVSARRPCTDHLALVDHWCASPKYPKVPSRVLEM